MIKFDKSVILIINRTLKGGFQMTSTNYLPGITDFRVYNYEYPDETLIMFSPGGRTEVVVEFKLTGLNMLIDYITNEMRDFYINVFLLKQIGGRETNVISHNSFYCDDRFGNDSYASFMSSLSFMTEEDENTGDFHSEFYYIEIIYSENEAEDGADINSILNDDDNRILRTKLMFTNGDTDE